jgi:hypothetical protein
MAADQAPGAGATVSLGRLTAGHVQSETTVRTETRGLPLSLRIPLPRVNHPPGKKRWVTC